MPKFTRTKENLEFLENLGRQLGDQRLRSFGLYVRLFKEFGREKMANASALASTKPQEYRVRYFLGILMRERQMKRIRRRIRKTPEIRAQDTTFEKYLKLREGVIRHMTPPHERRKVIRSRIQVKISKEERKLRRKPKKL